MTTPIYDSVVEDLGFDPEQPLQSQEERTVSDA